MVAWVRVRNVVVCYNNRDFKKLNRQKAEGEKYRLNKAPMAGFIPTVYMR